MKIPRGTLRRRRVVNDLGKPLSTVLEAEVTGYCKLETQDALLLDGEGEGIITFEAGVPMAAYHTGTQRSGTAAVGDMAVAGPYRIELRELESAALAETHETDALLIPPGLPAKQLAGDPELSSRTRELAPSTERQHGPAYSGVTDTVESFLDDDQRIESLRTHAREEARSRATEWGFETSEDAPL